MLSKKTGFGFTKTINRLTDENEILINLFATNVIQICLNLQVLYLLCTLICKAIIKKPKTFFH